MGVHPVTGFHVSSVHDIEVGITYFLTLNICIIVLYPLSVNRQQDRVCPFSVLSIKIKEKGLKAH